MATRMDLPDIPVPRFVLYAALTLVGFALLIVGAARFEGMSSTVTEFAPVVSTLTVTFVDREDGAVVALREDGTVQAVVAPETGAFVRGVLRSLVRLRTQLALGEDAGGFTINRLADGHLTLTDHATDTTIDLGAFGHTNQAAFAAIMTPEPGAEGAVVGGSAAAGPAADATGSTRGPVVVTAAADDRPDQVR